MQRIWFEPAIFNEPKKRGRKPINPEPLTRKEIETRRRSKKPKRRIAVLDMETDPFDNVSKSRVDPFAACLYGGDDFEPIFIWEEDRERFARAVIAAIESLGGRYVIYAHNGGRFDFMFLVHLLRGAVSFKGRGIMSCHVGAHELRDSFHLIPEKLAAYQKEQFDYSVLTKAKRNQHRKIINDYMFSDCRYLYELVTGFVEEFGLRMSIGQAAMMELQEHYEVKKLSENWDSYLRQFFFGGRVECLTGRVRLEGDYKLYDVNSMYPYVMAAYQHPIGDFFDYEMRLGEPSEHTVFVDLDCRNSGALVARDDNGETTTGIKAGRFFTTVHEYRTALRLGLISEIQINFCIDCKERTDFRKFVEPLYQRRQLTKKLLADMRKRGEEGTQRYIEIKRDDLFLKLLMNNAYGKFAQNPRRFKEYYLTDPGEMPPEKWFASIEKLPEEDQDIYRLPESECESYWIWAKPAPSFRFNNVGTAASITGAARAVLMEALHNAVDPIYCDTDSIICRELPGVEIDGEKLGAWDLEDEFSKVIIDGKKLYSCWYKKPKKGPDGQISEYKIRSKGASGLKWQDMEDMFTGKTVPVVNRGVTMTRVGDQFYMQRKIRATAKMQEAHT